MSKPSNPKNNLSPEHIQFIDFWVNVAAELGTSRLKINHQAKSIHDLFHKSSEARPYLVDAIKQSYVQNKCQHLRSAISINVVLDILGATAFKLFGNKRDDLLDIELLEEIAWYISNHYLSHLNVPSSSNYNDTSNRQNISNIVSLSRYKTIKKIG